MITWTVYDRGTDGVDAYAVRGWRIGGGRTEPEEMSEVNYVVDLEALREQFRQMGMICMARDPADAFNVLETWL